MKTKLITLSLVTLLSAGGTHAAVIASYDFEAGNRLSTDSDTNTSAGALTDGAGVGFSIQNSVGGNNTPTGEAVLSPLSGNVLAGNYTDDIFTTTESLADALTDNNYISFTLTTGGSTVDLSSLNFSYQISGGGATPGAYLLAESVGGTFDAADLIAGGDSVLPAGQANTTINFDLTSVADITTDTEFRLYLSTTASTNWGFAFDNIQLEGTTTAIPEPASAMLCGLGGLLLLLRRRRCD